MQQKLTRVTNDMFATKARSVLDNITRLISSICYRSVDPAALLTSSDQARMDSSAQNWLRFGF